MARLYADENFPWPVVELLRAEDHDILTILETGFAGVAVPDEEVLRTASALNRAVLTLNRRDFVRLHLENPEHSGIVVCTVDRDFAALAQRIHDAVSTFAELDGRLVRINRPQTAGSSPFAVGFHRPV